MKRYIQPQAHCIRLHAEQTLMKTSSLPVNSDSSGDKFGADNNTTDWLSNRRDADENLQE